MSDLRATYRLQLTADFSFAAVRELIPYLRDLGISHLYLSPSFQARPGSTHGYDVIDPARLSEDLGGLPAFHALAADAHAAGLGIILDVVPNHMCVDDHNRFWADPVLREQFFDVDAVTGRHRRFFDVDELAAVRQEDPAVFEATHGFVLGLTREGLVDGLRVDHPDGLADPAEYLGRLRAGGAADVWVEKILDPDEHLREWPVTGTVGYEFLNDVAGLYVDPAAEPVLTALWERVSGDPRPFSAYAAEAKLQQATGVFRPELERLARVAAANFAEETCPGQAYEAEFTQALARALASLPIYRTYIQAGKVDAADREAIEASGMDAAIAQRLLSAGDEAFVTRFQQTTPAIMAKGVEDTAFYRYCRLLTLNDVGGDPSRFGVDVERFHAGNLERSERFPRNLLTTMTHDAKRSADARARIGALSQVPDAFAHQFDRFTAVTDPLRAPQGAPDDVERFLIFQTLLGVWPIEPERLQGYLEKALREAKRNTNWIDQNTAWEDAVHAFCAALYEDDLFAREFGPFVAQIADLGERSALGQLVLKLTSPGIPDIYQGDELPYLALVDPDNRRPVDWELRQALLARLLGGGQPGRETLKLYVTTRLLGLRARRPDPFAGSYEPLDGGPATCAFVRGGDVLVLATLPRSQSSEPAVLADAPAGTWRDVLSGSDVTLAPGVPVSELVGEHGFAVLERAA